MMFALGFTPNLLNYQQRSAYAKATHLILCKSLIQLLPGTVINASCQHSRSQLTLGRSCDLIGNWADSDGPRSPPQGN
jgi:hypothetical protein